MEVCEGTIEDISSWMKLVGEVKWNFPGLDSEKEIQEHKNTVLRLIGRGEALCVKDRGMILGVLLFSRKHNMICCLAVSPNCRRQGIGSLLLEAAIQKLDPSKDITVTTFRETDPKGAAPRALYQSFGFIAGRYAEEFGYPVQEFVLPARSR